MLFNETVAPCDACANEKQCTKPLSIKLGLASLERSIEIEIDYIYLLCENYVEVPEEETHE